MRSLLLGTCALLAVALAARADIDPGNFDRTVKPSDDFYEFANGRWLAKHPIPPSYRFYGVDNEVMDRNQAALHTILEDAARAANPTPIQKQVGDFYASGMDEAAVNAAGIKPIQGELDALRGIKTPADVAAAIAHFHTFGIGAAFFLASEQDPKNSEMVIAGAGQGGLGLPDRDYYLRTDANSVKLRQLYVAHVTKMLQLAGESASAAQGDAQAVMALETTLAKGSKTNVELRDPVANYHKLPLAEVQKLTPHFDWSAYFSRIQLSRPAAIDVGQPAFFQTLDGALAGTPVPEWRAYLRWHLIHEAAPYLDDALVQENFNFYGKTLNGTPALRERWKRVLATIDGGIGEALGQLYVAEYFPPSSKARMLQLVRNIHAALREDLRTLPWMDAPTRAAAIAKLNALNVKIGYPDKWKDYSQLVIDRGNFVQNVLRSNAFSVRRDLNKIGKPVDRAEWLMTPPTVNAYYDPSMNEIVFPAGILQPPFFDAKADDALNYGAIGAVIGHETTHGFDDEGRQFDPHGNLTDWWTPESAKRFQALAQGIIKQFNGYVAIDDLHVNGELTQGENIADLGGLKLAYRAFEKTAEAQSHRKLGGFTPEQRFFLAYASSWRENIRPEALRLLTNTDPHSPNKWRVDGPLSNLPEFAEAFGVPAGAPMRRPADERVVIW
ncbi:MAG TPA: M13 family metallopeptidase [Opitutaceae bacterium]|nr:M13 family metallopeptidase [Opitutaceae bacterium]